MLLCQERQRDVALEKLVANGTLTALSGGGGDNHQTIMKGIVRRKDKILPPSAIAGCLDVLCKAYAQIAPVDTNLAGQINEAIETIMEACNSEDSNLASAAAEEQQVNKKQQFKEARTDIIEDIFTGEVLYRGFK